MTDESTAEIAHEWDEDDWNDVHTALCEYVVQLVADGDREQAEQYSELAMDIGAVIDV